MAKKYYWIKLKTDFFNSDEIDFLLSQKNGCEYIVLYQMLCLNTANNGGELASRIGEMIVPYDVNKIVRDTKYFSFDTVTIALGLFKQLGLIYEEEGQVLKISNYDAMVGSNTEWAEKKRKYREKQKLLGNTPGQIEGQKEDIVRQEIEIDIEKDIDIDIEKDKKKEKKESKKDSNYDSIINELVSDEDIKEALYEFIKMRKLIKKPMTDRALTQLINKLYTLSTNKEEQLQILDNSIINNWSSIYPLKNENTKPSYKREEIVPEWFNKDQKTEELSKEDLDVFSELEGVVQDDFETRRKALQERLKGKYGKDASQQEKTS